MDMKSRLLKYFFWGTFCLFVIILAAEISNKIYSFGPSTEIVPDWIKSVIVFSMCSMYLFWSIGNKKAIVFLIIALSVSFLLELIGVTAGYPLGITYSYDKSFSPFNVFGLPVIVPINWAIINILGYSIVTSMLTLSGRNKPNANSKKISLVLLIILDALVVTSMDVILDPLRVAQGSWTWLEGGPFYGVPISNYIGWFVVASISIGVFRIIEYKKPGEEKILKGTMSAMPPIIYMLIVGYLAISAVDIGMLDVALIGVLSAFPAPVANIILYLRSVKRVSGKL
jgi:putative membrane protein